MKPETRGLFVRMFSGAVLDQALLSASSLAVGLLLIMLFRPSGIWPARSRR